MTKKRKAKKEEVIIEDSEDFGEEEEKKEEKPTQMEKVSILDMLKSKKGEKTKAVISKGIEEEDTVYKEPVKEGDDGVESFMIELTSLVEKYVNTTDPRVMHYGLSSLSAKLMTLIEQ